MPNLVGIFDPDAARADLESDLERMLDAVDYPAFGFARKKVIGEGIAVGNVLPGIEDNLSQPVFDATKRVWLMLDGEILDRASLERDLLAAGIDPLGKDDAELALASYLAFGERFFERLDGAFNLVLYDGSATFLITDRVGTRLLFFAHDGKRFVFASEMKGVIQGRKIRSRAGGFGMLQLLTAAAQVGRHTWIEGIELCDPGTVVRLDRRGVHRWRYWRFHFEEGSRRMSDREYAAISKERLGRAVARAMKLHNRHPIAITLSGGLDSRSIALSIPKEHLPIDAITYGNEDAPDVRYARQLAEVVGLRHHFIEGMWPKMVDDCERIYQRHLGRKEKLSYYSAQLERVVWRSEALSMFDALSSMIWHPLYRKHMRFMLNGAAGDALTGSHIAPYLMLSPSRSQIIRRHFKSFLFQDRKLVRRIATPAFYQRFESELYDRFALTFSEIDADQPAAVASVWDMENRQRRGAFQSFTMERYFCVCRAPFVDGELVDHLTSVPAIGRFQQRIYKRMIVEGFPHAAHVPWAYTEGRITTSPAYEFAREAFNFARARLARLLPRSKNGPPRWEFRDNARMMREDPRLADVVLAFTTSDAFPSDVLDANGVRTFVDDFRRQGGEGAAIMFSHLCGLATAIELFLAPDRIRVPPLADPAEFGVER